MAKFIFQASVFFNRPLYPAPTSTVVTVYNADTDSLAQIWDDRDGLEIKSNPFSLSSDGVLKFYTNSGRYNIVAANGADSRVWSDVIIVDPESGGGGSGGLLPGRVVTDGFTLSESDLGNFIESSGDVDIEIPDDETTNLGNGFNVTGYHDGGGELNISGDVAIVPDVGITHPAKYDRGSWMLRKKRSDDDTWLLSGSLENIRAGDLVFTGSWPLKVFYGDLSPLGVNLDMTPNTLWTKVISRNRDLVAFGYSGSEPPETNNPNSWPVFTIPGFQKCTADVLPGTLSPVGVFATRAVAFSPAEDILIICSLNDGQLHKYSYSGTHFAYEGAGPTISISVYDIKFTPDGTHILVFGQSTATRLLLVSDWSEIGTIASTGSAVNVDIHPLGTEFAMNEIGFTGPNFLGFRIFTLPGLTEVDISPFAQFGMVSYFVKYSHDGTMLAVGRSNTGSVPPWVSLLDVYDGYSFIRGFDPGGDAMTGIHFNRDDSVIYISYQSPPYLKSFDVETGDLIATAPDGYIPSPPVPHGLGYWSADPPIPPVEPPTPAIPEQWGNMASYFNSGASGTMNTVGIGADGNGVWVAGISHGSTGGHAARSTDNGETWSALPLGLNVPSPGNVAIRRVVFGGNNTWIASMDFGYCSISTNNGETWAQAMPRGQNSGENPSAWRALSSDENGVFVLAGSNGRASRTDDYGASWSGLPQGMNSGGTVTFNCLANDKNGNWVVVGNSGRAARSTDNGETWSALPQYLNSGASSGDIINLIYAGNGVFIASLSNGYCARSTDNGETWSALPQYLGGEVLPYTIVADGQGVCYSNAQVFDSGEYFHMASNDYGNSWAPVLIDIFAFPAIMRSSHYSNGFYMIAGETPAPRRSPPL